MFAATTLTIGETALNLYKLLTGATSGAAKIYANLDPACCRLTLQSSPGNDSSPSVYVGDSNVSASNAGLNLQAGDAWIEGAGVMNNVSLVDRWLVASAASTLVNVTVEFA